MIPTWILEALPLQPNTFKFETNFGWRGQVVVGAKSKYHVGMVALHGAAPLEYSTYEWNVRTRASLQTIMADSFEASRTSNHLMSIILAEAFTDRLDYFFNHAIEIMLNLENSVWEDPDVVTYSDADIAYASKWTAICGDFTDICRRATEEPLLPSSLGETV